MMLRGPEIVKQHERGDVRIEPFEPDKVGANSYDLRLYHVIKMYKRPGLFARLIRFITGNPWHLDCRKKNPTKDVVIPDQGFILKPGHVYLGRTVEVAGANKGLIPCIDGRSSLARLGISAHIAAGFGDDGYVATWTLELTCQYPVKIYLGMRICQIYFMQGAGLRKPYGSTVFSGKYQNGAMESRGDEDPEVNWQDISSRIRD